MFFVPIPRAIAKERGFKTYFSGSICKRGFISPRQISNSDCLCILCAEYRNNWKSQWQKDNPEKVAVRNKKWRQSNPDKINEKAKRRRKRVPEIVKASTMRWRKDNPNLIKAYMSKRHAIRKCANMSISSELTDFVFTEAVSLNKLRESLFSFKWHVDHMIPLQNSTVCGLHVWNNFQCLPVSINASKQNKLIYTNPHEWLYDIPKFFKVVYQQEIAS